MSTAKKRTDSSFSLITALPTNNIINVDDTDANATRRITFENGVASSPISDLSATGTPTNGDTVETILGKLANATGGITFASAISGLGSETGQVANADTLLQALAKINDRLPLSGGTLTGNITTSGNMLAASLQNQAASSNRIDFISVGFGLYDSSNVYIHRLDNTQGLVFKSTLGLNWGSGSPGGAVDLKLVRDAANTLAQRVGTAAQENRVYQTYTDASNHVYAFNRWNSNEFQTGVESAGTGVGTNTKYQIFIDGTMALDVWTSALLPGAGGDGLGASGRKWGNGYFSGSVFCGLVSQQTSAAADPTTTEYPTDKDWGIHKNTTSGNVFLAVNDGGTIKKVQLT